MVQACLKSALKLEQQPEATRTVGVSTTALAEALNVDTKSCSGRCKIQ